MKGLIIVYLKIGISIIMMTVKEKRLILKLKTLKFKILPYYHKRNFRIFQKFLRTEILTISTQNFKNFYTEFEEKSL